MNIFNKAPFDKTISSWSYRGAQGAPFESNLGLMISKNRNRHLPSSKSEKIDLSKLEKDRQFE